VVVKETPLREWAGRLESSLAGRARSWRSVRIVKETASTQDAARRLGGEPGLVVIAGRQTAGRGRFGRAWADTGQEGLAMSLVLEGAHPTERLSLALAVGAALAIEDLLRRTIGIKWPNDLVVAEGAGRGGKVAGILVERGGGMAIAGIGINVNQERFAGELRRRAASLRQLAGTPLDRAAVAEAVLLHVDRALATDEAALAEAFAHRDVLCGRVVTLRSGGLEVRGRVRRVDPLFGLEVEPSDEFGRIVRLKAATTTLRAEG
jgi:BirA family biotin operon repressor/biotin-[acetyl-CoA-carboxylase] ligase